MPFNDFNLLIEKGGIWAGLALVILSILRAVGLRASKDAITLKADASERDAYDRLTKRVELLDRRLNDLEDVRNHLFGFITKCMSYISQCQTCTIKDTTKLTEIELGYKDLISRLSDFTMRKR